MKRLFFTFCCIFLFLSLFAQNPVTPGDKMTDFTLKSTDGKTFSLSDLKGRNVMLVFPRGKVGKGWCNICHYQYAELADLETQTHFRKKYNLEVLFILPYNEDEVNHWVSIFPSQLEAIEKWKHPVNLENLSEKQTKRMNFALKLLPKDFDYPETGYPMPFPVLADTNHQMSSDLGIFTTDWDGSQVDQNISSIYIVNKDGVLKFKYVSQNTVDRPKPEYLFEVMHRLLD